MTKLGRLMGSAALAVAVSATVASSGAFAGAASTSAAYSLRSGKDGAVIVARGAAQEPYRPVFTIVRADADPKLRLSAFSSTPGVHKNNVNPENYPLPEWRAADGAGLTDNIYAAGAVTTIAADASRPLPGGGVAWTFPDNPDFTLTAELRPVADAPPRLSWKFTAKRAGWYSVGYTGGPAIDPARADGFLQPLIWQEKRFPRAPLTSAESMGGLPLTLFSHGGLTSALSVDPAESPFRLPTLRNARFGVVLRNPQGQAQPSAFAPLFGGSESHFAAGQSASFAVRPLLVAGGWYEAFTEAARDLFGFSDVRQNGDQSLNATIDTMTDFAMDDVHSGWNADLKGFDYDTDVRGTVKVVSALHPLATALIQDDPEIYRLRALPITEFLMSRSKYLYNSDPNQAGQNAARDMKGPAAEVSELAELYEMSRGESPVFKAYALNLAGKPRALNLLMVSSGDEFWNKLALYRLTGDKKLLDQAKAGADAYIARRVTRPQTDFSDVNLDQGGQFWSDFAPRYVELFELWQETREPRYLAAADAGARQYASYAWYFPAIPAGTVTVDKGGRAPVGHFDGRPGDPGIVTPEQTLPAWRVSQIGLLPEAQTTYALNPGVFLAPQAAYDLRIAAAARDQFLHDAGRAAIVGRYKTYPGYDINVAFSDVYDRADYPNRPFRQLNYNEIYYNHVWPHIALLIDYLMSDFETRTNGAIAFPSRYAQGYAYLRSKVYGDRPGVFMGDSGVRLWMPRHLVSASDPQANYVTGYGNDKFYLALSNEAPGAREVTITLNRDRVPFVPGRRYEARLWRDGKAAGSVAVIDGKVTLPLSGKGITAIAVDGLPVFKQLQERYFSTTGPLPAGDDHSFRTDQSPAGNVTAMMLGLADQRDLYVWTSASDSDVQAATLTITTKGLERTITDRRHPFEFSVPIEEARKVTYTVSFLRKDNTTIQTDERSVER